MLECWLDLHIFQCLLQSVQTLCYLHEKWVLIWVFLDNCTVDFQVELNQLQILGQSHVDILVRKVVKRIAIGFVLAIDDRGGVFMVPPINYVLKHASHPGDLTAELEPDSPVRVHCLVAHEKPVGIWVGH